MSELLHYDRERERKQEAIEKAKAVLTEEGFEAVVLMATWTTETGETAQVQTVGGNWYAQNGMADYFLAKRREAMRIEQRDQQKPEES